MTDLQTLPDESQAGPFIPPGHDAAPERRVAATGEPTHPRGARSGDLTGGPVLQTLLVFALPMLASNVLQSLNGSVNAMWVGRLLGESALAATANGNVVLFVLVSAVFGFGMATTVKVGQAFGANDIAGLRRTFGSGLGFCVLLAIVVGAAGWIASPSLLEMLSTPRESMIEALAYLRVVFVTMPFTMASVITSMAMRGAGNSRTPLHAMILTVCIDVVMNPLLIRGIGPIPAFGIAGSAFSTAVANLTGFLFQIWRIYAKGAMLALPRRELGLLIPRRDELGYIIGKGVPMGAQMLLASSAGLIMIGLVNREGLAAAAAYGASLQLWNYLQMPAFAIGSAVSAMVAQAIGAGLHGRIDRVTYAGMATNLALTTTAAAIIIALDRPLLSIFLSGDDAAMAIGRHIQLICTASFVIFSVTMVLSGTMRAYGAVIAPVVILFLSLYPGRLGFYALARPWIGSEAVWWAYPVGSTFSVILTFGYYRFGGWRDKAMA